MSVFSVMELVDAAIPLQQLDPVRETILKVEGVKVCSRWLKGGCTTRLESVRCFDVMRDLCFNPANFDEAFRFW